MDGTGQFDKNCGIHELCHDTEESWHNGVNRILSARFIFNQGWQHSRLSSKRPTDEFPMSSIHGTRRSNHHLRWSCCIRQWDQNTYSCTKAIEVHRSLDTFVPLSRKNKKLKVIKVKEEQKKKSQYQKTPAPSSFVVVTISQSNPM
jgi:hypothetical protein